MDAARGQGTRGGQDPQQLSLAVSDIESVIPPGTAFILVDDDALPGDAFSERRILRFLGCGAGDAVRPADDEAAVEELHRLRRLGASHIVFALTGFPLLERYAGLGRYLQSHFPCLFRDDHILAFGLQRYSKEALLHTCVPQGSGDVFGQSATKPCVSV
jgi:hypothetical protein